MAADADPAGSGAVAAATVADLVDAANLAGNYREVRNLNLGRGPEPPVTSRMTGRTLWLLDRTLLSKNAKKNLPALRSSATKPISRTRGVTGVF